MSVDGTWKITVNTPMGPQESTLTLASLGSTLTGTQAAPNGEARDISEGMVQDDTASWKV